MAVRYEFDQLNRLVIRDPHDRLQPRRVLEGDLSVDRDNRLSYRLRATPGEARAMEREMMLDGRWTLTPDHRLGFTLHPQEDRRRQTLFFNGTIVDVRDNALAVSLWRREDDRMRSTQTVALSGRWQADARNRLSFLVSKADGSEDRLVFNGAWTVNRNNQLLYRYQESGRGRRQPAIHTLRFTGMWDLLPQSKLVYRLDLDNRSVFEFQAALQSSTLNAREGKIAYQVGIRLSGGRAMTQRITFFGIWKVRRDLSVAFEIPYTDGRRHALKFTGAYTWLTRNAVSVQLANLRGEPLGVAVTFHRTFLDDAQLFLRLQRLGKETQVLGGATLRF
ncbi:MAG: hypothetical protein HY595_00900 [Candidatus Omnitrophica bacterium]|nr:hypothetical protein [Candidatus Omnitrophota bacterium]